jgi:hypothetical protein
MRKSDYDQLAQLLNPNEIAPEVIDVLDEIVAIAGSAAGSPAL